MGRREGIATDYENLELIFESRGELDEARKLWSKARDLYAKIGMPHETDEVQRLLDSLPDAGDERS